MKKILITAICIIVLAAAFFIWRKETVTVSMPTNEHVVAEGMETYSDHGFNIDYPEDVKPSENQDGGDFLAIRFGEDAIVDYISSPEAYDASLKTYGQYTGIEKANGYNFHMHEKKDTAGKNILTYSLKAPNGGYIIYLGENSRMSLDTFFLK